MVMCKICTRNRPCKRGLCNTCYQRERKAGRLANWPVMRNNPANPKRPVRNCGRCGRGTTSKIRVCRDCQLVAA